MLFGKFVNEKGSNFVRLLGQNNLYTSPETDIVPELIELAEPERTFTRCAYSLFKAPGFKGYLDQNGIQKFDLCGLVADSCVLATAFEGFDLGYEIRVLRGLMETKPGLNDPTETIFKRNIDRHVK
jgi:nicotinamidase-related amidase